ncbi:helix-turn-helix transcriptional regulator [Paeniglutamicibacter antarcticus]|uniref:Helix-turn-helix transcriptional regulator n=1 Tax=Arthrobacter terrae TaxID=2935737 RepID=A0A931CHW2_9MICC|nr:helix-turn-helix transcriptional regulator [Arthrobacter terrae]MBG0738892.1 helix-turn-helix transcriptional regulator [Arthrobacter terrae]
MAVDIGRRIAERRNEAGLNQRDLENLTGISQSTLCRIENGSRAARMDDIISIAWALGCPVEAILDENPVRDRVLVASRANTSTADAAAVKRKLTLFLEMDAYLALHGIGA